MIASAALTFLSVSQEPLNYAEYDYFLDLSTCNKKGGIYHHPTVRPSVKANADTGASSLSPMIYI